MLQRGRINQIIPPLMLVGSGEREILNWYRKQIGDDAYRDLAADEDFPLLSVAMLLYDRHRLWAVVGGDEPPRSEEELEMAVAASRGEAISLLPPEATGMDTAGFSPVVRKIKRGWRWEIGDRRSGHFPALQACLGDYIRAIEMAAA